MMNDPLVSVAIITYNQKELLIECIESVLAQSYTNIEIIVADDNSIDGTIEVLKNYSFKYPNKFKNIFSDKNQGITINSNKCLEACEGKYIAFMGGDDLMLSEKINIQVDYMEKNLDSSICYHNLDVFDHGSNTTLYLFNKKINFSGTIEVLIKNGCFNGACSTMIRRSSAKNCTFNPTLPVASDWLFWIEILSNGGSINYIDLVLGRYRRHDKNVTISGSKIGQNEIDTLNACNIIMCKYPKFINEVNYIRSLILLSLRKKIPYKEVLKQSLRSAFNYKAFGAYLIFLISFSVIKL